MTKKSQVKKTTCECANYQGASCAKCAPQVPHTPGPWMIGGEHTSDAQEGLRGYFGIGNGSKGGIAHVNKTGLIDRAEAQANARLIAAAPELLEALRLIARNHIGAWDPREIARAAIAKVEGR